MDIRATSDDIRGILSAATKGDIEYLDQVPDHKLKAARCNSGCTALHWAAGSNQVETLSYLIKSRHLFDVDVPASKKSSGRTALHYAARNGCFESSVWLVEVANANINALAKHGVTPFQLAVWQNQLRICRWMVLDHGVDPCQLNNFSCGAVHWLGICPFDRANQKNHSNNDNDPVNDGSGLIPIAKWLATQSGIDWHLRQRQGHTPLHKASWGGHLALIQYLRNEHDLYDDVQDDAGNYAADLADMANTSRHARVAQYLRQHCSRARADSCAILGVPINATLTDIKKAYRDRARMLHPDRKRYAGPDSEVTATMIDNLGVSNDDDFDALHKAYRHLTEERGHGKQSNPAHSLNLMLQVAVESAPEMEGAKDDQCFKARLIAVLLEYGDKGLDLSNVRKKWRQVWPDADFPNYEDLVAARKGALSEFLLKNAGDVIELVKDGNGSIRVFAKSCTQASVAEAARRINGAHIDN